MKLSEIFPRWLYYFGWIIALPILVLGIIIHIIINPKQFKPYLKRLGIILPKPSKKNNIWIHAVSVGEVAAAANLIPTIQNNFSNDIVLTCSTITGYDMAMKKLSDKILIHYFPFDFPLIDYFFIKRVNPYIAIFLEMEIWPSIIHSLYKRNIPIFLVNARLGDTEFKRYSIFKKLFNPILSKYSIILCQSYQDKERFNKIGAKESALGFTGNIKYDLSTKVNTENKFNISNLLNELDKRIILTLASSHSGEEKLIIQSYMVLKKDFKHLQLIIVPRHPHRTSELETILKENKLPYTLRQGETNTKSDILIINTIGEMMDVFDLSDLIVMGGSFSEKVGGHNIIEPASLGKPVIVGPHMENFRDVVNIFKARDAYVEINYDNLTEKLWLYIADNNKRLILGNNQYMAVKFNKGASRRTANEIKKYMLNFIN